jgi:hypothetical protein
LDVPLRLSGVDRGFCDLSLVGKQRRRIVSDQTGIPDHLDLDDHWQGACNADRFAIR